MIRLKNELFENQLFIESVRKINDSEDLNAKDAYWFNRFTKELKVLLESYDEIKKKLLVKYGKEDEEKPGMYTIEKEKLEKFQEEMTSLNSQVVKMKLDKIDYPENLKLSPNQMSVLEDVLNFDSLMEG